MRVDSAAYQGYKIPPFYDSMIGKLIVYGSDREQAIVRMRRALAETLFEGVVTGNGLPDAHSVLQGVRRRKLQR